MDKDDFYCKHGFYANYFHDINCVFLPRHKKAKTYVQIFDEVCETEQITNEEHFDYILDKTVSLHKHAIRFDK